MAVQCTELSSEFMVLSKHGADGCPWSQCGFPNIVQINHDKQLDFMLKVVFNFCSVTVGSPANRKISLVQNHAVHIF